MALCGVVVVVCGIAMFWGSLRQVLVAPVMIGIGVGVYIAARTMWWLVDRDLQARS